MESMILLIVAVALVAGTFYAARHKLARDATAFAPADHSPAENAEQPESGDGLAFEGWNRFTSNPFSLTAGAHRMTYAFPDAVRVEVEVCAVGDQTTVLQSAHTGSGAAAFSVPAGTYTVRVKPSRRDHHWEIEFTAEG
jgi:hypothetical protein